MGQDEEVWTLQALWRHCLILEHLWPISKDELLWGWADSVTVLWILTQDQWFQSQGGSPSNPDYTN